MGGGKTSAGRGVFFLAGFFFMGTVTTNLY